MAGEGRFGQRPAGETHVAQDGPPVSPELPPAAARWVTPGPVRLHTLSLIRWIAIAGQAVTLLAVYYGLGFPFPLEAGLVIVAVAAGFNLLTTMRRPPRVRVGDHDLAWHFAFDVLQLSALLSLTGGLQNPFSVLVLAPVMVSATLLSERATLALCSLAIVCLTAMLFWHMPLPWPETELKLPPAYQAGLWTGLVLSILFIAGYTLRVTREARRMSEALVATEMALAREQRLAALGGLAAAAAHELGSPLSTIALVTKELSRDLPADSPFADDIQLLQSQSERCRDILAELGRQPETGGGAPYDWVPLSALVEAAAAPHHQAREDVRLRVTVTFGHAADGQGEPAVPRDPAILHGLGNLIQNALQFARSRVTIVVHWALPGVTVRIADDGPGFPPHLLERLGEPYLSSRRDPEGHMGLGIFIAETLLAHSGAQVRFANRRRGGAEATVTWDRAPFAPTSVVAPAGPAGDPSRQAEHRSGSP